MNRHGSQVGHATATTNSGRTYVAVASPSREDDTRPAGHIKKPSTIRGEAHSALKDLWCGGDELPRDFAGAALLHHWVGA